MSKPKKHLQLFQGRFSTLRGGFPIFTLTEPTQQVHQFRWYFRTLLLNIHACVMSESRGRRAQTVLGLTRVSRSCRRQLSPRPSTPAPRVLSERISRSLANNARLFYLLTGFHGDLARPRILDVHRTCRAFSSALTERALSPPFASFR